MFVCCISDSDSEWFEMYDSERNKELWKEKHLKKKSNILQNN